MDDASLASATELSRRLPPIATHPALVWNPRRRALTLVGQRYGGCFAWEWTPRGFAASVERCFDEPIAGAHVTDVCAFCDPELEDVVVVGVAEDQLLTAPLSRVADAGAFERFPVKCQPYQGRLFASWVKPGEVWLHLPGEPGEVWALLGSAGSRSLARLGEAPPGLVSLGFDEARHELVAVGVTGALARFDGRAWHGCGKARSDGSMAWHPTLGLVMLQHDPEGGGLELVRREGDAFVPVRPKRAAAKYVSGFVVGVDLNDNAVVFHGGQDFEKGGGDLTNASLSSAGEGAPFVEPPDPWRVGLGRYNDTFTVDGALVIATHGERLATYTFGGAGVTRAELRPAAPDAPFDDGLDDRAIHIAGDARGTFVFDGQGAVRFAQPGAGIALLAPAPPKKQGPRVAYAHRTAVVVDELGRLLVHGPETASETWRLEGTAWRQLVSKARPPRGNTGLVSTPAGVYAYVNGQLWLLHDDAWTKLGAGDPFHARMLLAHRAKRRLLAVRERIVGCYDAGLARVVPFAELPEGFDVPAHTMNKTDAVGIDEARDRLIAANDDAVVAIPLSTLEPARAWPAPPAAKARAKRAKASE